MVDRLKRYQSSDIANSFGHFYANLSQDLTNKIKPGSLNIDHYIKQIPRQVQGFVIKPTIRTEVEKNH